MRRYIGTKIVHAEPGVAPRYMGEHKAGEPGMIVEYEDGYRSWSPMDVFERAYRPCEAMTFGLAIEAMRKGARVSRAGWNGKGQWIAMIDPAELSRLLGGHQVAGNMEMMTLPYIYIRTVSGELVPWLASQTDMLADDWMIVDA